ncbi:MAG: S9 family peptidase [Methyloligellaceae bacterium]
MVAGQSMRFGLLQTCGDRLYWSEARPAEQGRVAIMSADPDSGPQELLPAPFSARSRVHEYGGGEFLVADDRLYFINDADQDVYELKPPRAPRRLTEDPQLRFADLSFDRRRRRLIAVAERHLDRDDSHHPENLLVAIDLQAAPEASVTPVSEGADFFAAPRVNPDGGQLAWLAWDLPHMPWEAAALHVASLDEAGGLGQPQRIAGGAGSAVFQPEWTADGRLLFVWDETGWGNLYAWDGASVQPMLTCDAELGRPLWAFGMRSYACLQDGRVAMSLIEQGEARIWLLAPSTWEPRPIEADLRGAECIVATNDGLGLHGFRDRAAPSVLRLSLADGALKTVRDSATAALAADAVSVGRLLRFAGDDGEPVHALYYPPANAAFEGPEAQAPPVIVTVHGGPTGSADRGLKLKTQFWTSRGFAVCDIDYSGSWGYGRRYRERLDGAWGVRDVADVSAAARHLADMGLGDPERLLVSGGSAGGYTVLLALAELEVFAAGACYYGVCDLAQLQKITHKFEAGYLYGLTGTEPGRADAVFAARSPLNHAGKIRTPVVFFQGLLDKVVPPQQSQQMVATLKRQRVPVAYLEFEAEGHGFRQAAAIETALRSEYAFYAKVLSLPVREVLPAIEIENWPA